LGDIHGSTAWKDIVKQHSDCRVVFLGDYLDPYTHISEEALLRNLREIITFKQQNPDRVVLLLGNHDLHYFVEEADISSRFNMYIAPNLSAIFHENYDLFRFAFQEENCVFTHAGISQGWWDTDFHGDSRQNIAGQLNHCKPEQTEALFRMGYFRGGKKGSLGGIFWADIEELHDMPLCGYTQIVGHNRVNDISDYTHNGGRIIFCDCLWNRKYLII
jgi:hypothetical protein